jgi:hypothetical protein
VTKKKENGKSSSSPAVNAKATKRASRSRDVGAIRSPSVEPLALDWSRFDGGSNHRRFEDLALDLFVLNYGEEGFSSNSDRGGPDGGADGIFIGRIGNVTGVTERPG